MNTATFLRSGVEPRSSCAPANRSRGSTRPAAAMRADALASITSHPAFVTTRDRPSCRNGMAWILKMFLSAGETNYFFEADWTNQINLNSFAKFRFT
jgi:hypothetical protein